jgi:RHS repeat-associated protein
MKRDAVSPSGARIWLVFEYDAQGRRIRKTVSTYAAGGWAEQTDAVFLYDGWNVMAELDANAAKARLRTYVWGNDLSGSLQGAGGVGGLLWENNYQTTYQEETLPTGVHFVAYDGNGNVMALVKAADATVSGRYEYGPFAEPVRVSGPLGRAQPFRFSTKWTDAESGLVYYGFRYLSPTTGRCLSRDPIAEKGEANLYGFTRNGPAFRIEVLGLTGCQTLVVLWIADDYGKSEEFQTNLGAMFTQLSTVDQTTPALLVWRYRLKPINGKAGKQKITTFDAEDWKSVFFVDVKISSTPDKPGGSFEGYGKNFGAFVCPNRIEMEFDLKKDTGVIPPPWTERTGKQAYTAVSGLVIAHEILHSLGAEHVNDLGSVMAGSKVNRWLWLNNPPEGVDDENRKRVKKTLGID